MDITIPILILAIPLAMFLFLGIAGVKLSHRTAGVLGCLGMGTVMLLSYFTAYEYFFSGEFIAEGGQRLQYMVFNQTWLAFTPQLVIKLDHHGVYEHGFQRFYAFLSLFSFSMLGLVVATNIFQMYIFWELVGASSYLLIGFYYTKPSAVSASKKAFIVTRFADLGFLVGILILSYYTGTFDFMSLTSAEVAANTYHVDIAAAESIRGIFSGSTAPMFMGASVLTWALVLIFMGGMGKSAMLQWWLPVYILWHASSRSTLWKRPHWLLSLWLAPSPHSMPPWWPAHRST